MTRYRLTHDDIAKAVRISAERKHQMSEAKRMRRDAELVLLNKLLAEAAMPEWYPKP